MGTPSFAVASLKALLDAKMNVVGVQTQSIKGIAWMTFTVEVSDAARLARVLGIVADLPGMRTARRR